MRLPFATPQPPRVDGVGNTLPEATQQLATISDHTAEIAAAQSHTGGTNGTAEDRV